MKAHGSRDSVFRLMAASRVRSCQNEDLLYKAPSMADIVSLDELAELEPSGVRLVIGGVHLSRLPIAVNKQVLGTGKKDFVFTMFAVVLTIYLLVELQLFPKVIVLDA